MDDDEVVLPAELDGGTRIAISVVPVGGFEVGALDIKGKLEEVTSAIEKVGGEVLAAVRKVEPSKATVELGFGLAIESGHVIALLGKGRGEASIRVVLEWSRDDHGSLRQVPPLSDVS
jgi:Trypsin-co-occurring domain 1